MIVSSVLVCQRTPQDTRLIIMCSPFVTRSVLLILSLSASLGVSDNLLRRKPLICSELVYSAKKYLCRKAYWLLWQCNLTVLKGLCGSEHIFWISKLRWFCVWMCIYTWNEWLLKGFSPIKNMHSLSRFFHHSFSISPKTFFL